MRNPHRATGTPGEESTRSRIGRRAMLGLGAVSLTGVAAACAGATRAGTSATAAGTPASAPESAGDLVNGRIDPQVPARMFVLHGWGSPFDNDEMGWFRAWAKKNFKDLTIEFPVAKSGAERADAQNKPGDPSWFRYTSFDAGAYVPSKLDTIKYEDVYESMYLPSGTKQGTSLWQMVTEAAAKVGAPNVILAGESQGGMMAAAVGFEWNRQNPDRQLGRLGFMESAPYEWAWQPRPESDKNFTPNPAFSTYPPRYASNVDIVLAQNDDVFLNYLTTYLWGPLYKNNKVRNRDFAPTPYFDPAGNVFVEVVPKINHGDDKDLLLQNYVGHLSLCAGVPPPGPVPGN